jgi:hypothetical protein
VPYLENATAEPSIEIELTEAIIAALQDDNTLRVWTRGRPHRAGRTRGRLRPRGVHLDTGGNMQVDEYQVQISVELTMRRMDGGETSSPASASTAAAASSRRRRHQRTGRRSREAEIVRVWA